MIFILVINFSAKSDDISSNNNVDLKRKYIFVVGKLSILRKF